MSVAHDGKVEISSIVPRRDLTEGLEEWLLDGLIEALPNLEMARLFAIRRDMFRDADLVTVATDTTDGAAVGALSSRWSILPSGRPFLHVLAQFIGERHQRSATFPESWGSHFAEIQGSHRGFPDLIVLKTYNPIAYCAMGGFARIPDVTMYPDVTPDARQDPGTQALAREVAGVVAPGHAFDAELGVIRNSGVPRDLYPDLPKSSRQLVNDYFAATTRPGDRMLCMLSVPTKVAARAILSVFGVTPVAPKVGASGA